MQRFSNCCPRCDQPLGISCDMWGKYYLCGACGFTAEDDDDLNGKAAKSAAPPMPTFTQTEAQKLTQSVSRW
jgi:hypothetical protein